MQQNLVSIVIPFKNTEQYISECVDSILSQSYKNWEAIFVDDHSEDQSHAILKNYSDSELRIKVLKNEGHGIIKALQTAFKQTSGVFIARMDSDDIMTPNRLEVMVNNLKKYGNAHVAIGQVNYFREGGVSEGFVKYEQWLNRLTQTGTNYSEIYKECVIPSPCWMIYREDFIACGGFEPNRYPEDYDLAFRFYKANYKCIPCDKVLLHWRDYSERTSRNHKHYAENSFLDLKVDYFLELDYDCNRPLTIWGAGAKGKKLARLLIKHDIPFYWICDNPKKIGKDIYDQKLKRFNFLSQLCNPQSIVTVANETSQREIKSYFEAQHMNAMFDYFFFC